MSSIRRRIATVLLALAVMLVLAPTNAFAVTKTVGNFPEGTAHRVAMAKATVVKKGTTVLKFKKGSGIGVIKFTPTASKKYTFTFAKVAGPSKYIAGSAEFFYMSPYKKTRKSVKLAEGVRPLAFLCNANLADGSKFTSDGKTYKRLATRRIQLTLKKGKPIYIWTFFENESYNPVAVTARLKIQ